MYKGELQLIWVKAPLSKQKKEIRFDELFIKLSLLCISYIYVYTVQLKKFYRPFSFNFLVLFGNPIISILSEHQP